MRDVKLIVVVVVAIAAVAGAYLIGQEEGKSVGKKISVDLTIDFGNSSLNYSVVVNQGASVYDVLVEAAHEHNFSVVATYYSQYDSYFIESINGVKNGNGKYWQYWVNGEYANVGANLYKVKNGDSILWKLAGYE